MNAKLGNALVAATSLAAGSVAGAVVSRKVLATNPKLEGVLLWASGALIGVGATLILGGTPAGQKFLVTKSEAGAILASGD